MSQSYDVFRPKEAVFAIDARTSERASFITRTYLHLFGAILAFIVIEAALIVTVGPQLAEAMLSMGGRYSWLIILGLFMVVSYVANRWAMSDTSVGIQYAGLGLYVVAEAILFLPLILLAAFASDPMILPTAGIVTLSAFTGLTAVVFFTRKNFSFLGPFLGVAGMVALGFIVCSILFGFSLGIAFTCIMIAFACGYILYDTSRVLHDYRTDQHVAASLALFASVALLFWYVLRLFMSRD